MNQTDLDGLREGHRDMTIAIGFLRDCLGKTPRSSVVDGCLIGLAAQWRAHLQHEEDMLARLGRAMSQRHVRIHLAIFGAIDALLVANRCDTDVSGDLVGLANYIDMAIRYENEMFRSLRVDSADALQAVTLKPGARSHAR